MNRPVSNFAERLNTLMRYYDLRQSDIAEDIGISKARVCSYLKNKYEPKTSVIYALSQKYNVAEEWLLGYDAPMFKPTSDFSDLQNAAVKYILQMDEEKLKALYELIRRM